MGTPIPVPLAGQAGWRTGWPYHTRGGAMSYYIFEVLLLNGTVVDAVVDYEFKDGQSRKFWQRPYEHQQELSRVVGWLDNTSCADVSGVMAQFVEKPYGVINPTEWGDALNRHIRDSEDNAEVTCEACARKFVKQWHARHGTVPEGWEAYA